MIRKLTLALALTLVSGVASAQVSKYMLQVSDLTLIDEVAVATTATDPDVEGGQGWTPVLNTRIHTSSQKDLVFGVSLEAGLYTDTTVSSSKLRPDQSTSTATIQVRVRVDDDYAAAGRYAAPGDVTFASREQGMLAKFGGYMECIDALTVDTDGDGIADAGDGIIQYAECTIYDESLQLWLKTLNANSFTFALDDVGTGWHDVAVEARILLSAKSETGAAATRAWVGKGALTVEEVRLVKGTDITKNPPEL